MCSDSSGNVYSKHTADKGKGLFSKRNLQEGDVILSEKPLACCQFSWNSIYKYVACNHCMKSLETAEEMARRLAGNREIIIPHKECCEVERLKSSISKCNSCGVSLKLSSVFEITPLLS